MMRRLSFSNWKKIYWQFFKSYLIVLCLSLVISLSLFAYTAQKLQKQARADCLDTMRQAVALLDVRLTEVRNMVEQIAMNPLVSENLIRCVQPDATTVDLMTLRNDLPKLTLASQFVKDIYLVSLSPHLIVSNEYVSQDLQQVYKTCLEYPGMSFEYWCSQLQQMSDGDYMPQATLGRYNVQNNVMLYVQQIPFMQMYGHTSFLALSVLNCDEIHSTMAMLQEFGSEYYIFGKEEQLLISSERPPQTETLETLRSLLQQGDDEGIQLSKKNGGYYIYTTSESSGWQYVIFSPTASLYHTIRSMMLVFGIGLTLFFILGLAASLLLCYRNSQPILNIARNLRMNEAAAQNENTFDFIAGTISNILTVNDGLRKELQAQLPMRRSTFYERLFKGMYSSEDDACNAMLGAELVMLAPFQAVVLRIQNTADLSQPEGAQEYQAAQLVILNVLRKYAVVQQDEYQIMDLQTLALISHSTEQPIDSQNLAEKLKSLSQELLQDFNLTVIWGIGAIAENLLSVSTSYFAAMQSVERQSTPSLPETFENTASADIYWYPPETEIQLTNCIKTGKKQDAQMLLHSILEHNNVIFSDDGGAASGQFFLYLEIRATLLKLYHLIPPEKRQNMQELSQMLPVQTTIIPDWREKLEGALNEICDYVVFQNENNSRELLQNITDFIEKQYRDPDLCLYQVASRFHLSEKYLSRFFKENTGENFTSYIERLRMNEAAQLLGSSGMKVCDIASYVGYANINTFYKAFKRIHGCSPSNYKNNPGNSL